MAWLFYLSQGMLIGILDAIYNIIPEYPELLILLFSVNYVVGLGYYYLFVKEDTDVVEGEDEITK